MENKISKNIVQLKTVVALLTLVIISLMSYATITNTNKTIAYPNANLNDSTISVQAFMQVYKVLLSPRCVNCHPAGDVPLQGDDSHLHAMLPQRGATGKGLYAMKCANCHQDTNLDGPAKPPGNPHWQLPPVNMKMIFEGRTPRELAKQLVNKKMNGNKNLQQLLAHANDTLVKGAWNPGEGRTVPPLSYAEFKTAWTTWIKKGAKAPPSNLTLNSLMNK